MLYTGGLFAIGQVAPGNSGHDNLDNTHLDAYLAEVRIWDRSSNPYLVDQTTNMATTAVTPDLAYYWDLSAFKHGSIQGGQLRIMNRVQSTWLSCL